MTSWETFQFGRVFDKQNIIVNSNDSYKWYIVTSCILYVLYRKLAPVVVHTNYHQYSQ